MTEQLIDLTRLDFWLVFLCGILFISPLTSSSYKSLALSALNIGFLFVLLQWHALYMVAFVMFAFLLLKAANSRWKHEAIMMACMIVPILFLLHKLPFFEDQSILSPAKTVLSVTGFSYIALRAIEVFRAVYEGANPPPTLIEIVNYLIPFHMLAAGPIQAYSDYANKSVEVVPLSSAETLSAIERIVFGLFKKFVLAYFIKETFLTDFESNGIYFFFEVQLFFLWLFLDFSAYSDIAVGIGKLLGIPTPENFNRPYLARNAIDFWDRWHISLSAFIRRNIFIPLQLHLNRRSNGDKPLLSASLAFSVAFILCGLWHGLTINFFLWGAIHAVALVVTNYYRSVLKRRLGNKGVKKYLQNRYILYTSRFITYEYVAFSLVVLFFP